MHACVYAWMHVIAIRNCLPLIWLFSVNGVAIQEKSVFGTKTCVIRLQAKLIIAMGYI